MAEKRRYSKLQEMAEAVRQLIQRNHRQEAELAERELNDTIVPYGWTATLDKNAQQQPQKASFRNLYTNETVDDIAQLPAHIREAYQEIIRKYDTRRMQASKLTLPTETIGSQAPGKGPRIPTEQEAVQLIEAYTEAYGKSIHDAQETLSGASIAVWPNYASDFPGYSGKVLSVVYGGSPNLHDMFTEEYDTTATPPTKTGRLRLEKRQ